MKVTFFYFAQVRRAAGLDSEAVELPAGADVAAAVRLLAEKHGTEFRKLVLDDAGGVRPSLLTVVNGLPALRAGGKPLADGDGVTLLSAVSGG